MAAGTAGATGPGAGGGAGRTLEGRAERRPSSNVILPSVGSSGGRLPVATANNARMCSGVTPGFVWIDRTPRAYSSSDSSATCELRGSRC